MQKPHRMGLSLKAREARITEFKLFSLETQCFSRALAKSTVVSDAQVWSTVVSDVQVWSTVVKMAMHRHSSATPLPSQPCWHDGFNLDSLSSTGTHRMSQLLENKQYAHA